MPIPKKILIVEDDRDLIYMIKTVMENNGFEVMTAEDGAQALKLVKTNTPDLIITDLSMPVMSGWHFSMKIRQEERFKNTPIIVLSGLIEYETEPQKFEPGTIYLPKPFDILILAQKVKELLKV